MNEQPFQGLRGFLKDQEANREERDCVKVPFHLVMEIITDMSIMRDRSGYKARVDKRNLPSGLREETPLSELARSYPEETLSQILEHQYVGHKDNGNIFKNRLERIAFEANQDNCRLIARIDQVSEQSAEKSAENLDLTIKVHQLEEALKAKTKLKRAKKK